MCECNRTAVDSDSSKILNGCAKGNSTSKTPSLQNVSSKLAEILQAYSILKVMILCKISAPKSESGALCEFFKFSLFFASFLAHLFNFDVPSPKCSKNYPKIYFRCKISRSIEFCRQNWPKYPGKTGKLEKTPLFLKNS